MGYTTGTGVATAQMNLFNGPPPSWGRIPLKQSNSLRVDRVIPERASPWLLCTILRRIQLVQETIFPPWKHHACIGRIQTNKWFFLKILGNTCGDNASVTLETYAQSHKLNIVWFLKLILNVVATSFPAVYQKKNYWKEVVEVEKGYGWLASITIWNSTVERKNWPLRRAWKEALPQA